jgi:hypothetical protein
VKGRREERRREKKKKKKGMERIKQPFSLGRSCEESLHVEQLSCWVVE